jgi:hypothetical protein
MGMPNPDDVMLAAFSEVPGSKLAEQEPTAEAEPEPLEEEATTELTETADEAVEEGTEEEVAEEAEEDTKELYTIKIDGEEAQVTLSELKAGYMKDADYRRKTAEISTVRKETEADRERLGKGIQALVKQLSVAEKLMQEASFNISDEQLDQLAGENPAEYVRLSRIREKNQQKMQALYMAAQEVEAVQTQEAKASLERHRAQERELLAKERPEFRKPEAVERVYSYLQGDNFGFTKEVLDTITDRRFVVLADKARRYDAMMAKGAEKKEVVAAKVIKSSASRPADVSKAQDYQRSLSQARKGDKAALDKLFEAYL